jgi:hypothetical protein
MEKALLIQGPLNSSKGGSDFDCIDTIARNFSAARDEFDYFVVSTWANSGRSAIQRMQDKANDIVGPSRWSLVLCEFPEKKPIVTHRCNPSRNIYLQAESCYQGLRKLGEMGGVKSALKIRTDMEFKKEFFVDNSRVRTAPGKMLVKAFRPKTPWFFGDAILLGEVSTLQDFFSAQLKEPQFYVNTHFEHFRLAIELNQSGSGFIPNLPSERNLDREKLSKEQTFLALRLWQNSLELLPSGNLYPYRWRGIEVTAAPEYEILNSDNRHPVALERGSSSEFDAVERIQYQGDASASFPPFRKLREVPSGRRCRNSRVRIWIIQFGWIKVIIKNEVGLVLRKLLKR